MKSRILIVDDEPHICQLYSLVLQKHKLETISSFYDGAEAVRAFENDANFADVVLMDYRMPGMDGLTAGKIIKDINPDVRLIMISAFDEPPVAGRKEIFDAVLRKPVNSEQLVLFITALK